MLDRCLSNLFLQTSKDGAFTAYLSNLFPWLSTQCITLHKSSGKRGTLKVRIRWLNWNKVSRSNLMLTWLTPEKRMKMKSTVCTLEGLLRQLSCGEFKDVFSSTAASSLGHPLCTNPVCGCITLQGQCDVLPFWPWHWQCPLTLRMQEMGKGPVQTIRTVSDDDGEVMGLHLTSSCIQSDFS